MSLAADIQLRQGGFDLNAQFSAPGDGITALFGPSGGGKSTLLAALAGLKKSEGTIVLGGRDVSAVPAHGRGFGLVFQDARLFPHLSAGQNIAYAATRAPHSKVSSAEVAAFFEISHLLDRPVGNLSGGEKSRVALARALVAAPDYLLLDEPFAALDGIRRRSFISVLLAAHRKFAIPMMVVTHSIDDAAALADHLVALDGGKVVAAGAFAPAALSPAFQALLDPHDVGVGLSANALLRPSGDAAQHVWLRADHVLVAGQRPEAISARNILSATIAFVRSEGADSVLAGLVTGAGMILARITRQAAAELQLAEGKPVFALIKSHAL